MADRYGSLDEIQALVDDLAAELGRSVVVNDPSMHLLHASRHYADEDPVRVRAVLQRDPAPEVADYVLGLGVAGWAGSGVVPANPALELRARWCVPVRHGARLHALLLVIDAVGTLTGAEVERLTAVAAVLGERLGARQADAARTDAERDRRVVDLLDGDAGARESARRRLVASGLPELPAAVVAVVEARGADPSGVPTALRAAVGAHTRREQAAVGGVTGTTGRVVALFGTTPGRDALEQGGRRLAAAARRGLGAGAEVSVGVGAVASGLSEAWRSAGQAALAVRAAHLLPRLGGVACWADVADHAVLLRLPDEALTADLVPEQVRALVDHDAGERLRSTLEVFLDQAGSVPRTAARLHLHRTSLYYRLRQIAEITGADLDDGRQRLVLHQGLRALELLEGR